MNGPKEALAKYGARVLQSTVRRFGHTFEKRRGFLVKLGQFLAFEDAGFESELGRFFYDLPPISLGRIRAVITESLGVEPLEAYEFFDPKPMAAASIAQVHRARLPGGEPVVVKVQYPTVAQALEADAKLLAKLASVLPSQDMTSELVDEIQVRMLEETDFVREANQTEWFHENLRIEGLRVPKVHRALCGPKVLTLEHLDGQHIGPWLESSPSSEARDRAGRLLSTQFWTALLVLRRVHADLHPGNVLLSSDGAVGLIDFGSTKEISADLARAAADMLTCTLDDNPDGAFDAARAGGLLGPIDPAEGRAVFDEAFRPFLAWLAEPLRYPVYDFAQALGQAHEGRRRFLEIVRTNPRRGVYRPLLFLNRTVYLLYSVLERIGGSVAVREIFDQAKATANSERLSKPGRSTEASS